MKRISEYVTTGHPDKTADFISEYLLDRYLEKDPNTRYAVEVQIKDQHVTLAGEITSKADFTSAEIEYFVRKAIATIGYTGEYGTRWKRQCICAPLVDVSMHLSRQSPNIAKGVNNSGWGDQGIFFGYAEYGSHGMMPKDHQLARFIGERLMQRALEAPELGWGLDIKTQVVMPEDSDIPDTVIVAIPLMEQSEADTVATYVKVLLGWTPELGPSDLFGTEVIVNGTGAYQLHSSVADCGTTGRKLAVDFYGGNCRIGGGSPWTKDGSKADLTLNLYARELAIKAAHKYQKTVTASLACCIGRKDVEVSIYDETGKTLEEYRQSVTPAELTERYGLKRPIFADLCRCGLFGCEWEWDKTCHDND